MYQLYYFIITWLRHSSISPRRTETAWLDLNWESTQINAEWIESRVLKATLHKT